MADKPGHIKLLEDWMKSYKPEELFDDSGKLIPELAALAPGGEDAWAPTLMQMEDYCLKA